MDFVTGQPLVVEIEFRLEGVLTDPSIVRCLVRSPTGEVRELVYPSASVTRRATGIYRVSVLADKPGTWAFRGTSVGVVEAVKEVATNVAPSMVLI
jgi:hypothetical protein